jgi:hypothetical protein
MNRLGRQAHQEPSEIRQTPHVDMTEPAPEGITLQAAMTKEDYARYAAVVQRHGSNWMNWILYVGTFFAAIPVALVFRLIGQHSSIVSADADLIGKSSLFAFLLGVMAIGVAWAIMRRAAMRKYVTETRYAFEPKTVTLDATGVTTTGHLVQASWRWAVFNRLTVERGLILLWMGRLTALAIPERSFASPAARDAAIAFIRARLSEAKSDSSRPA